MSCEDGDCPHKWHYAPHRSLYGALELGRGLAVARLRRQPQRAGLVYRCCSRDTRWDWQIDSRSTYLARLLRDLHLDVAPLIAQLYACGPYRAWPESDPHDEDNQFDLTVGVLTTLARAGDGQAREALHRYVHNGVRWIDALTALAVEWPVEWWDDLWETAAMRVEVGDAARLWPSDHPWSWWRGRDARLDGVLRAAARSRSSGRVRRTSLSDASDADLIALLQSMNTDPAAMGLALGQIRHRGRPIPELLDLVERVAPARPAGLFGALRTLGPQILPHARAWAADADHPLFRDAPHLLAEQGDEQDIAVLFAALDQLGDEWCGYDVLSEGLARILATAPPAAYADAKAMLIRRLRLMTVASPHSYERASYLRSLLLLDEERTTAVLPIHLFDCEPSVRLLAARHTPLTEDARSWLAELRDDPIEEADVRLAAAERLPA
ncbi:hypothetical protein [Micromonospora coerulea]|uniref:hypothetical protein n=1 Tax=Micromonospora coerulea TaxID=47856 RepID=UPI0019087206|nr:hypothetical protein [Micromonospora veneta]